MQTVPKVLTQRERLEEELVKIAADVSVKDKQDFTEQFDISFMTISRYLRGDVTNIDTAADMLEFFRNRIQDREEKIKNL